MARTETVTVMFTDLVGSTELSSRLGHDAYEVLRQQHFAACRAALAMHHGTEIKTTGDGLMLCFTSAADAVACGVAFQQAISRPGRQAHLVQMRVGISAGEATREDNDLYGPPVVGTSLRGRVAWTDLRCRRRTGVVARQRLYLYRRGRSHVEGAARATSCV